MLASGVYLLANMDVFYHKLGQKSRKNGQKALFLPIPFPIEIRTISPIISIKSAEFLVLMGIAELWVLGGEEVKGDY